MDNRPNSGPGAFSLATRNAVIRDMVERLECVLDSVEEIRFATDQAGQSFNRLLELLDVERDSCWNSVVR